MNLGGVFCRFMAESVPTVHRTDQIWQRNDGIMDERGCASCGSPHNPEKRQAHENTVSAAVKVPLWIRLLSLAGVHSGTLF